MSPPEAINDLAASNPTLSTVQLQWTAPHEDGAQGAGATVYDVRRSTTPITAANFQAAIPVPGTPPPAAPGVAQSMSADGLLHTTRYYFAMKSVDFDGNVSAVSNVVQIETLDATAPSAVADLTATLTVTHQEVPVTAAGSSGESSSTHGPQYAVDGDVRSYWSTPPRDVMQEEYITVDTGALRPIGRVRLQSPEDGSLFPEELRVELSHDNASFTVVAARTGLPATGGFWHRIDFQPTAGRYARIYVTKTRLGPSRDRYYAQIAEIGVFETTFLDGVLLRWMAPGDDGDGGAAAVYDVRYSAAPIATESEFQSATEVSGEPAPQAAGTQQSMVVYGLSPGTYYFAIKAMDEAGNPSGLSNSAMVTVP